MTDVGPEQPKNKGGRPKKYQSLDERKAARKAKAAEQRIAEMFAPTSGLPAVVSGAATNLQTSIAAAVSKLNIMDAAFVTALCGGASQAKAYMKASPGTSAVSARNLGSIKAADPKVAQAISDVKEAMAAAADYSFIAFMAEMDAAIVFAQRTNNATAYVRAVELKGKSTGHLSDKPVSASAGFTLQIVGIDSPGVTLEPL